MTWVVEPVPELQGYTVEWAGDGCYYLSRRNVLFHSADLRPPFTRVAVITAPAWKRVVSGLRLAQRLLRFMVTNVVPLGSGELFVTFDRSVGVVRDGRYVDLPGLRRPCRVLRSACALDHRGDVYFGEYVMNDTRGEVRVYRYRPGTGGLEVVHTFPPGSVRHIHGVYFDTFSSALLCLTGDDDRECRILRTDDGFRTMQTVGEGDETWRAVSMLFDESAMYYGMDAEFRANHVYRMDRGTCARTSLGEVAGTVYYSKQVGKDLLFTTSAENGSALGARAARLWHVPADGRCVEVAAFQKDVWHGTWFQFGSIHVPYASVSAETLYVSVVGVKEDNQTFRIRRTL